MMPNLSRHSPSTCLVSHAGTIGSGLAAGIAAGIGATVPEPDPFHCACPCPDCQDGRCTLYGTREQTERIAQAQMEGLLRQKTFRSYAAQKIGRTLESFRYKIEFLHCGDPVDEFYTDLPSERARLLESAEDDGYGVRITYGWEYVYPDEGESDD